MSPADPGVLQQVAITRSAYFGQVPDWRDYEVLVAVESCDLLGRDGWLISDSTYRAIVVDCKQVEHSMNGIMADTTLEGIREGWLVLR